MWRAYQLRADGPPRYEPLGAFMTDGWRNTIYPMAAALGVEMRQPARLPLTRTAHEAAAWARAQNRFEPFHQAVFRAHFVADQDISDPAVLLDIARRLSLNADDLAAALREQRMAEDVDEDLLIGRNYGIRGVPTFVVGGQLLYGVQPADALTDAVARADSGTIRRAEQPPAPLLVNITRK